LHFEFELRGEDYLLLPDLETNPNSPRYTQTPSSEPADTLEILAEASTSIDPTRLCELLEKKSETFDLDEFRANSLDYIKQHGDINEVVQATHQEDREGGRFDTVITTKVSRTLLHAAIIGSRLELVKLLVEKSADPNIYYRKVTRITRVANPKPYEQPSAQIQLNEEEETSVEYSAVELASLSGSIDIACFLVVHGGKFSVETLQNIRQWNNHGEALLLSRNTYLENNDLGP